MTRREIAAFLHMETSSVAGRVNELMHDGILVEQDDLRPCPITGRRSTGWHTPSTAPGYRWGMAV